MLDERLEAASGSCSSASTSRSFRSQQDLEIPRRIYTYQDTVAAGVQPDLLDRRRNHGDQILVFVFNVIQTSRRYAR
jgi:hypothetical protein